MDLVWMVGLGADRRSLIVELDPTLDAALPAATPGRIAYRDYQGHVRPGVFALTADVLADLSRDYDLAKASARQFIVRPVLTPLTFTFGRAKACRASSQRIRRWRRHGR